VSPSAFVTNSRGLSLCVITHLRIWLERCGFDSPFGFQWEVAAVPVYLSVFLFRSCLILFRPINRAAGFPQRFEFLSSDGIVTGIAGALPQGAFPPSERQGTG
jgi:hypothetical protein